MERWPSTPESNYQKDVEYRQLVDALEALVHRAQYTPTELREAVILAAAHYECRVFPRFVATMGGIVDTDVPQRGPR